ncbi:MAG: dienelactone hydrolase family protein [Gemmatimonadaceae bacterium]|nr:dienelactone hydrolase family protein [Gemmatimonadaceae bacterium]
MHSLPLKAIVRFACDARDARDARDAHDARGVSRPAEPRAAWRRWAALALVAGVAGCGAIIETVGGMGRWGWEPSPHVTRIDTGFTSGGRHIAVERFAPDAGGLLHLARRRHHPAILVLHSSAGVLGRSGATVRTWADAFAEQGYVAYVIHYFDRTGDARTDDAYENRTYPEWTATLRDAVTFVRGDAAVDSSRIDAFGVSLGGFLALALGDEDARVRRLVVLSGGLFPALAPALRRMPPTLLLHGAVDDVVPVEEAWRVDTVLSRLGAPHALVVIPGGDHSLDDALVPDAMRRAMEFLQAAHPEDGLRRASAPLRADRTAARLNRVVKPEG